MPPDSETPSSAVEGAELLSTEEAGSALRLSELGLTSAVVAHDFNNALTIILGSASMLRLLGGLTPEQSLELDAMEGAARHGAELVRQLLSHVRQGPGRSGPTDANRVITQMGWMLRHLGRRNVSVDFLLAPGLGMVGVDEIHLEQAVLNLAVNATSAMPDGGQIIIETSNVRLPDGSARAAALLKAGEYVRLSVTDSGLGMSADVQERLFQAFYTTRKNGNGLGLYSVRRMVRRCGGDVLVSSRLGEGTTFEVYLPRREA